MFFCFHFFPFLLVLELDINLIYDLERGYIIHDTEVLVYSTKEHYSTSHHTQFRVKQMPQTHHTQDTQKKKQID